MNDFRKGEIKMNGTEKQIAYATKLRNLEILSIRHYGFEDELATAAIQALESMDDAGAIIDLIKHGSPLWCLNSVESLACEIGASKLPEDFVGLFFVKDELIDSSLVWSFIESRSGTRRTFNSSFLSSVARFLNGGLEPCRECYVGDDGDYHVRDREVITAAE